MTKMFGTDGVRGLANKELTPELAFKLGRAAGFLWRKEEERTAIIVGRDSRISGPLLEGALVSGICSAGVDAYVAGVIPTPVVAYLSRVLDVSAGVVISASHNPAPDNGIKFFDGKGFKLAETLEERIEAILAGGMKEIPRPTGEKVGRVINFHDADERYVRFLKGTVPCGLHGLKIVVDCANGAAYRVAPRVLHEMGAQVISINDLPDGLNINKGCGSTRPEALQETVVKYGADFGVAFDGDADRVIAVDENGKIVDGDQILVICGLAMQKRQELKDKIVVTVMSNLGLREAFGKAGVEVYETKVGDRFVLEKMQDIGAVLGGEQSGHIIFLQHCTTGDGLLTALQLMRTIKEAEKPLSTLAQQMKCFPQALINVEVCDKESWKSDETVCHAIAEAEKALKGKGRIFIRASGTEPLMRIMAEGPEKGEVERIAQEVAAVMREKFGHK